MRFGAKALISAALAGPAMAALILTGAGTANAAVTAHTTSSGMNCNQFQRPSGYNQFQNQWNLSGFNTVKVKFEVNTYYYPVYFTQRGTCLTGRLRDPGARFTGRIRGTVYGNFIVFSVRYPPGSKQGTRTFNGTINRRGRVSGSWSETGPEVGSGSWSLSRPAQRGCQMNYQWNQNQGCYPQPQPY